MAARGASEATRGLTDPRMREFVEAFERAWADPASGELAALWAPDAESFHPEHPEPKRGRETVAGRRLSWEGVDRFDFPPQGAQASRGVGFFDTTAFREAVRDAA